MSEPSDPVASPSGSSPSGTHRRFYQPLIWVGVGAALLAILIQVAVISFALGRKTPHPTPALQPPQPTITPATPSTGEEGFVPLFNGKDLTDWDGDPRIWSVENGMIVGRATLQVLPKGSPNNNLIWKQTAEDFELRLSFRMPQGNSGIVYRGQKLGACALGGYQYEIWANNNGALLDVGKDRVRRDLSRNSKPQPYFNAKSWNELVIVAQGNHLTHTLNGVVTTDVQDNSPPPQSGALGIESALGPGGTLDLQLKNIRLKVLK